MKPFILNIGLMRSCAGATDQQYKLQSDMFTETEILRQLDLAYNGIPSEYYPAGRPQDIKYNFFLDLEDAYCEVAGNRIHLYADSTRWAIAFEKCGYNNRQSSAVIELNYVGNCITYPVDKHQERNYITNSRRIILIDPHEFERIENKEGEEMETFELIGKGVKEIKVRDKFVPFNTDYRDYEKAGVHVRAYENPEKLIGFGDFVRYLNETNPSLIRATDEEIEDHIPKDLPKLMTITDFHYVSAYDKSGPPSAQETYKLIAQVLVTKDTANWKPTENANNHWSNWESGNL